MEDKAFVRKANADTANERSATIKKEKAAKPVSSEIGQPHNAKKEALGPNTKH